MSKLKVKQVFVLIASLAAVAAINYSFFNIYYLLSFLTILIAHEFGHYFIAKIKKLNPDLPYFIPIPFFSMGVTHIKNFNLSNNSVRKSILFYGPFAAFVASLYLLLLSFIFSFLPTSPILTLLISELLFNYFGSDGKKYRTLNN